MQSSSFRQILKKRRRAVRSNEVMDGDGVWSGDVSFKIPFPFPVLNVLPTSPRSCVGGGVGL